MTSPSEPDHARIVRRRRLHERQAVVFGLLVALLTVTGLGALAVYTGAVESPFDRAFSTPEVTDPLADVAVPCLPEGAVPVPTGEIHVEVLNASGRDQIAGANAEMLETRGFVIDGVANAPDTDADDDSAPDQVSRTQIHFGAAGIAAAYTLAAHYPDPGLVLDTREDASVDLYIGTEFEDVVDAELVGLDPDVPLENPAGCVPLEEVTPRPARVPPVEDPAAAEG